MVKRIYIAAPWEDRALVPAIAATLEKKGYVITHKWWIFEGEEEDVTWGFKQECARLDVRGVQTADAVLLLNSKKSEGKATEQGIAIAFGIPIIIIGDKSKRCNIFQTLDSFIWVNNLQEALQKLEDIHGGRA